ncbi:MAG TPA: autotransporter-associated beta strand repeat-containing protein [Lacunisphaera sp.]
MKPKGLAKNLLGSSSAMSGLPGGLFLTLGLALAASASAATVTLSTTDGAGESSFSSGLHWSDTTAPSIANDYLVNGGRSLRTIADSGSATFAGNSLTLGDGTSAGTLVLKNQAAGAIVTIDNLTLNNGELQTGGTSTGAAHTVTIAGNGITLASGSTNRLNTGAAERRLIVSSPISGSGALQKTSAGVAVLTGSNSYTGGTTIAAGMLQFGTIASMPASGTVATSANTTLGVNVGGAGEFSTATSGAGSIGGLLAGTGGQGAPVTWNASASLGLDTTNATGTVTYADAINRGLVKLGTGTLELTTGGTYATNGAAGFPLVIRQGTLLLNGGTHTVTGEAVVGGTFTTANGAAGYDAKLQVDAGALNISGYLSVGRGNGVGGVSSDLVLNNSATVTAANYSGGYNAANAANLPKGTVTFNGSSSLTISGNGVFNHAESTGSNIVMTMNGSSALTATGTGNKWIGNGGTGSLTMNDTSTANLGTGTLFIGGVGGNGTLNLNGTSSFTYGNATTYVGYRTGTGTLNVAGGTFTSAGEVRVGGSDLNGTGVNGTGTVNVSGGAMNVGTLTIARGNNNQNTVSGLVNVTGGTLTSTNDVIVGYAGAANLGRLNVAGGTVNVGTNATKWLQVGVWDTAKGQVDISSGNLNLNTGSSIKFNTQSGTGANVINQTGGNVTFFSDNATTVGGAGVIDMQTIGAAASSNTYNLDGGTLTVPQIVSTATTGTRTFNLNGGTLKAAGNSVAFFNLGAGNARANVRNGGAILNTNGFNVTVAQALLHSNIGGDNAIDGGLTKSGLGTLTLSGGNTFTGATTISAGTLALASTGSLASTQITTANGATFDVSAVSGYTVASGTTLTNNGTVNGGFTVANGGTLNGSGTFNNEVTVNGALNPGNSPGSQTYGSGLTLGAASTTTMEIAGLGGVAGTDFDFINVTGGTLTLGGALGIVDFGGFDISAQTGTYNLFDAVAGAGDFASVTVDGTSLTFNGGTDTWSATAGLVTYDFAESNGVLSVTVVPEPTAALLGGLGALGLLRRRRES